MVLLCGYIMGEEGACVRARWAENKPVLAMQMHMHDFLSLFFFLAKMTTPRSKEASQLPEVSLLQLRSGERYGIEAKSGLNQQ
jgi:hypothetical protein